MTAQKPYDYAVRRGRGRARHGRWLLRRAGKRVGNMGNFTAGTAQSSNHGMYRNVGCINTKKPPKHE
jgi:hypothetical protein